MGPESLPALLNATESKDGVLRAVYEDLAAPGVRKVGKALETVLQTGSIVLLPLRMLNKHVEEFERRNFAEIAARISRLDEKSIVDVPPELGVPILESLSKTSDRSIRDLFIELLAKAADKDSADLAHPSFLKVIECLTPDEAKILAEWANGSAIPTISIRRIQDGGGYVKVYEPVLEHPDNLIAPSMVPAYISNMAGLGLLEYRTDSWLTNRQAGYEKLIEHARKTYPDIKEGGIRASVNIMNSLTIGNSDNKNSPVAGDYIYEVGYIEILPYGRIFQRACISN